MDQNNVINDAELENVNGGFEVSGISVTPEMIRNAILNNDTMIPALISMLTEEMKEQIRAEYYAVYQDPVLPFDNGVIPEAYKK